MEAEADGYKFTFDLNEDAENVTIQFVNEGEVIGSYDAGAKSKGSNTVSVPASAIPYGKDMNWQIKALAADVYRPVRISDDSDIFKFFNSFGVAIDNNPQSDYFGRIYVTNGKAGAASGRTTGSGLYILDPQLTDITGQGNTAYAGGVDWYGTSSPYRVSVAPDGRVFITDYSDAHSGIWIMDPANPSGDFIELFAGCTRDSSGLATNSEGVDAVASYNVYRNDVLLTTQSETTYTDTDLAEGTTYVYAVSAVYGNYETEKATKTVSTVSGIDEAKQALTVYPNPTDGIVNIEMTEEIESIQVYDMNGRLVLSRNNLSGNHEVIDLSDCKPGNYMLRVNNMTYRIIRK